MSRFDRIPISGKFAVFALGAFGFAGLTQANRQTLAARNTLQLASEQNRYMVERFDFAKRGSIFCSDGQAAAQSDDRFELGISLRKVPHVPGFYVDLASAAGVSAAEIEAAVAAGKSNITWSKPLGGERASDVQDVKTRWRAGGVSLTRVSHRTYPLREALSSVLGSMSQGEAEGGLEKTQTDALSGRNGHRKGLVDRTGAFLPMRMSQESEERIDGQDIVLTIDSGLQNAALKAVRDAVDANQATSGTAIIIDPKTGDLLAMANWPSVDPSEGKPVLGFNHAYSQILEPGSTFKIMTLAKALEDQKADLASHIQCRGTLLFGPHGVYRVRCDEHHGNRAHGSIDAETAIAKSCNVSAATWARRIGYQGIADYLKQLGLLEKTNIGVTHEVRGQFNLNDFAKEKQIANVGFGQSLSCTPLALASAFSMLGNEGKRMKPRLIKQIGDRVLEPQPAGQIVAPEVADDVLRVMESVIQKDEGTGAKLRVTGYRLAGKTGTAEKIGSGAKGYVASFVGFVPAQNPRAMVLVMVDNPKAGRIYGALVAGPVFHNLAIELIDHFSIPPESASEPTPHNKPGKEL